MTQTRIFIARHGETVFNAAGRIQGEMAHTPLTRAGFAQAEKMGLALRRALGPKPKLLLWASPTGRALQTLAVIAEHLELDWHAARTDARLAEIGMGEWSGLYYRDLKRQAGQVLDPKTGLFCQRAPGGEWYDEIKIRLQAWLDDTASDAEDRLVVMHGISSRVLRAILTDISPRAECGAPVADNLPQGSVVEIRGQRESVLHLGDGQAPV